MKIPIRMFQISFEILFNIAILLSQSSNLVAEVAEHERIVTDLPLITSSQGIPFDYSYNETKTEEGGLTSAPGCPKSVEGFPWAYYGNPHKCFLTGLQGPCSENRILFLEDADSNNGVCVCEICKKYLVSGAPMPVSPDGRYKFCGENNVYDAHQKDCYDLHNQGSCEASQWLVKDSLGSSVTCVPECPKSEEKDKVMKYDHQKGECILRRLQNLERRAQTYGLIQNSCPENQRYSSTLKRCFVPNQRTYLGIG